MTLTIDSLSDFTLGNFQRVAWQAEPVAVGPQGRSRIKGSRAAFMRLVESDPVEPIYGVTTGYGDKAKTRLDAEGRRKQAELPPYSLGIGLGQRLPERVVRGIVFARLASFVSGHAAVSPDIVEAVAAMLDGRALPEVALEGQIASGEVEPLNAVFGHLIGEGRAEKDGGSLVNGAPCTTALVADTALRAERRLALAHRVFALSIEACRAPLEAYDMALAEIWANPHDKAALARLNVDLDGADREDRRAYQAPVSWRIVPRVLAQAHRVLAQAVEIAEGALQSPGDNPLYLMPDDAHPLGRVLSNGSFHDCAPYWAIDAIGFAWAELAVLSGRHVVKLHHPDIVGSAAGWRYASGHNTHPLTSTHAWFARKARDLARPTFMPVDDVGNVQSDLLLPSFYAYEKEGNIADCFDTCLAILAAVASQVLWSQDREPAPPLRDFLATVRDAFPPVEDLRNLGRDVETLKDRFRRSFVDP